MATRPILKGKLGQIVVWDYYDGPHDALAHFDGLGWMRIIATRRDRWWAPRRWQAQRLPPADAAILGSPTTESDVMSFEIPDGWDEVMERATAAFVPEFTIWKLYTKSGVVRLYEVETLTDSSASP